MEEYTGKVKAFDGLIEIWAKQDPIMMVPFTHFGVVHEAYTVAKKENDRLTKKLDALVKHGIIDKTYHVNCQKE